MSVVAALPSARAQQPPTAQQEAPAAQQQTPPAANQTHLPAIVVAAPKLKPKPRPKVNATAPQGAPQQADATTAAQAALDTKMTSLDQARDNNLLPKIGASTYTISRQTIENLPQGDNTPIDKVILQMPGVSYDSAASNPNFHVRNEYANVQFRINGVVLPEGVSALGPFIDTNFIGSMSLLTGALPAQYGLRTAGVLDITSRSFATPGGDVSLYGGSRQTFTPSFDYGGSVGNSEYFVTARGNWNDLGLENPTPTTNAIHDQTQQGKFFGYASTLLDESTRLSFITAASYSAFQIPNNPGQPPLGDFGPPVYNSSSLNENEYDTYVANIAAWQRHGTDGDAQVAVYSRYADVHFVPDTFGDLVFNDVASDVTRESVMNGLQADASYIVNGRHTLRAGLAVSEEDTNVSDISTVLPGAVGAVTGPPFTIADKSSLLGWNIGVYIQDEWKLTDQLTLNTGLRFDQLYQYVDTNQLSPRAALVYKPLDGTTLHAGYARYFTPPYQAQAAQSNIALFANTTQQPDVPLDDPVKPERSHYFDVGVDQVVLPGLTMGLDGYYKIARDQLDDGQFGAAVVLTQFNYARGYSEGGEFKLKYNNGNFNSYANFSYNITKATDVESNQYLIDGPDYQYLLNNWHYTDDMQRMTGSAGVSYRWQDTLFTADLIYGSGLRAGDIEDDNVPPNSLHTTPYAVVNTGVAHDFKWSPDLKPLTVRFDVVNLLNQGYELRTGSGIGEFAPQYGARRGYYVGISQKL
ncbi:MAG TPA: TonB-dependent receptor [Xanthobacteraceae bacterium]|jgi:outer membrane receptor protein involved in Fe transport|nr:TonB-dependent receptor [Xanthobacteraceae bacterium]